MSGRSFPMDLENESVFNMLRMARLHVLYSSSVHFMVVQRHWGSAEFRSVACVTTSIFLYGNTCRDRYPGGSGDAWLQAPFQTCSWCVFLLENQELVSRRCCSLIVQLSAKGGRGVLIQESMLILFRSALVQGCLFQLGR